MTGTPGHLPHIALLGRSGAGKTTCATVLQQLARYRCFPLAEPLKAIARQIWGEDAATDRTKLQRLGVAVRDIETDAWVNLLVRRIDAAGSPTPCFRVAVDDCRFPNEYNALRLVGFTTIRVHAPRNDRVLRLRANGKLQDESQLEHESETALDGFDTDFAIHNDGDVDALVEQVEAILNRVRA